MRRQAALALACSMMVACGRTSVPATPTSPSTPASTLSPSNQPPQIVSATIDPQVGVKDLTTFTARAEATDSDGDPVTLSWSAPGRAAVATTGAFSFRAGDFSGPLTVTATDGHGGTATATVSFSTADLTAFFDGYLDGRRNVMLYMRLSRTGGALTGSFTLTEPGSIRYEGSLDSDDAGQVDEFGRFRFRVKLGSENFTLEGRLEPYPEGGIYAEFLSTYVGRGRIIGGKYDGHPFIFGEHNPY